MKRKFRYLRSTVPRAPRLHIVLCVTSCFQLLLACGLGFIVGFNIRDVMTRTCWKPRNISPDKQGSVPRQIAYSNHAVQSINTNETKKVSTKKTPAVFRQLPEKFLKHFPPSHEASWNYYLSPWKFLKKPSKTYFMIFLIKSARGYASRRFLIRQTWGSISNINQEKTGVSNWGYLNIKGHVNYWANEFGIIFLIGETSDVDEYKFLAEENDIYGDILNSNAPDTYVGLPQKVLSTFNWINNKLHDVSRFYVTTDDDCFMNLATIYDYFYLNREGLSDKVNCGFVYGKEHTPIRKQKSKWGVSYDVYPGDVYPPFCHGGMIVWPYNILTRVVNVSKTTNITGMHLEDVLLSGILRQKAYNTTRNIIWRGYRGMKGKYRRREPFVHHLGLSKNLRRSFEIRWREMQTSLRMSENDSMIKKRGMSAYHFNATVHKIETMRGKTLNQTFNYFLNAWKRNFDNKQSQKLIDNEPSRFYSY